MSKRKGQSNIPQLEKKIIQSTKSDYPTSVSSYLKWLPGIIAVIVTFIVFTTAIKNDFVNWDDDRNFYENPLVQNISKDNFWKNTKEIFSSGVIGNYNPLTIWTFAIENRFIGLENPSRWHLHNIFLHLLCVFLSYRIALLLGLSWRGAIFLALLFGIHPMRVESVAWVTERKDVLFGAFYLGALLQYVKYKHDQKTIRWLWMTSLFVLSLFSKIQAVSLPLSMMAVDYFMDKKWEIKTVINKIPFFILSLIFGIVGVVMLKDFGSLASAEDTINWNFFQRLFLGAFSFIIYLIKLIVPFRMSPLYPYPSSFPWYFYPSMLIAPIVIYTLYISYKKEYKALFFGLAFFIVNIIFLLQILGAGQGYLADRFTYIAYFGLFFVIAYYVEKYLISNPNHVTAVVGSLGVYLVFFAAMTFQQNKIWKNSATLWTHVLKYYQQTTLPYGNRANYYRDNKMYTEALADYNKTISMKDAQPQAYNSRARLFFDLAKGRDTLLLALADYNKAISYDSTDGEFLVNRGATYARLGDVEKAIENFNQGLKLKPDHAVGYLNRSIMYNATGKIDLAHEDITSYLKLNPYNPDLWYEKGRALRLLERPKEAIQAYDEAIKLKSNNKGLYHYERSRTYAGLNMMNEAKADLQAAIQLGYNNIDPTYRQQLGM
ncbi:MAG TPA: tetratricopeptide repeat protein [Saprospiraceae bacterium]|nr:tetratricopeptide repeat protein [Saprospiraceae bacterium]